MGRYNSNKLTTKFIENYIKNRLWEKNSTEYVPFLNVRSVPTMGKANRIIGWKSGREHHFLSKLEYAAFYHFEWSEDVVDIKEQYPLLPMETLQNIALEAGIDYPSFGGDPIIMTTDFLITIKQNGNKLKYARTIKPSTELSNPRILEKFEIERRFFNSQNIDWGIITEKELPEIFTTNMEILHSNKLTTNKAILEKQLVFTLYNQLSKYLVGLSNKTLPVSYILSQLSKNLNITLSDMSEVFFKAIIDRIITFDIYNKPLNIAALTIDDIKVNDQLLLGWGNTL